jgi:uncharacterized membrane protein
MKDLILITLLFAADGVVLIALGVPLLKGQVSPNSWYGFRTRKTLSDEKTWYAVNRVAGRDMVAAGAAVIAASLVLLLFGRRVSFETAAAVLVAVTLLSVGWMVLHGFLTLRRM